VSLETPKATRVLLDVFDVSGRRVWHLSGILHPTGNRQLAWNGRNERGLAVAGGIYFVRLTIDNQTASRKIVILR